MTIAEQLNITEFPLGIWNKVGYLIYYEDSDGCWVKYEYDSNGYEIYSEDSHGYWVKQEYDSNGKRIYYETSWGDIIDRGYTIEYK